MVLNQKCLNHPIRLLEYYLVKEKSMKWIKDQDQRLIVKDQLNKYKANQKLW